uniref:Uncharacterized protein n=1 Tax=Rhizophagus irregularis (strain DAOM 181602 / DAOM 197198 / MUCL 43194) TaxID=747089 RepID=U9V411_RHIID
MSLLSYMIYNKSHVNSIIAREDIYYEFVKNFGDFFKPSQLYGISSVCTMKMFSNHNQ